MAEKLSWAELRRLVATRAGVSEKTAGAFLNALTAQLLDGLKTDKQVKINGLGTFKLQAVAPRKSVDVSTGEEITIEGYNKIVFSPEAGVKELVEKGPVTEAADPLKKLGEQADEIVDLLNDLGQSPQQEPKKKQAPKKEEEAPVAAEEPVVAEEPAAAEEPVAGEPVAEEPAPVEEPEPEPEPEPASTAYFVPGPAPEPAPEPEKKSNWCRVLLILLVILLILLVAAYFFRAQLKPYIITLKQYIPTVTEQVEAPMDKIPVAEEPVAADTVAAEDPDLSKHLIPEGSISREQILAEFMAITEPDAEDSIYPDLITVEPMHQDSRLAWMSKRFYGSKVYWPYLYDANRGILKNPCLIEVGTPIRVPRLTPLQLDTTNEETRATIERLRLEAEEACRN